MHFKTLIKRRSISKPNFRVSFRSRWEIVLCLAWKCHYIGFILPLEFQEWSAELISACFAPSAGAIPLGELGGFLGRWAKGAPKTGQK